MTKSKAELMCEPYSLPNASIPRTMETRSAIGGVHGERGACRAAQAGGGRLERMASRTPRCTSGPTRGGPARGAPDVGELERGAPARGGFCVGPRPEAERLAPEA